MSEVTEADTSTDHVEVLVAQLAKRARINGGAVVLESAAVMRALLTERDRLKSEVASLRITLGGKTFSGGDVPEPIGCPAPGACSQVAEIKRLRAEMDRMSQEARA
jgi:hypothetical protein